MGRQELHSDSISIEQQAPIIDHTKYSGDIVIADKPLNKDWLDALEFNEEPVTIRIEPSAEKNAAGVHPIWVNGKGAEVFQKGQWMEIGYLPVGRVMTIKRKYVAVLASAKFDNITTEVIEVLNENPNNTTKRVTSRTASFSVIEDKNPKGAAWLTDLIRRNM